MKTLFSTIRRLGQTIVNPDAAVTGQSTICNTGLVISMIAEKRLIINSYVAMHQKLISG